MRGVRAEWHLAELAQHEADPFAAVVYSAGVTIDLTAPEEELDAKLKGLLEREGRLDARGLTCALKDAGQDCRDCPQATLDQDEKRSVLCRLGKDQHMLAAHLQGIARDRMGEDLFRLRNIADEGSEIGHLDAELAELLTAVGV